MIRRIIDSIAYRVSQRLRDSRREEIEELKSLFGAVLAEQKSEADSISEAEFKVFSQWGDDGIIQYLIRRIPGIPKTFIEFGVEDYTEANTRFLLINNNWSGLVMDGSQKHINYIKKDSIYWKHSLNAKCSFITAENINQLISEEGISGEIGILHIDIDGNDYWILKALNIVEPVILIMEYNSAFGTDRAITVPYRDDFVRHLAHPSNLYAGASLKAIYNMAISKGYVFVGCNSTGNNAYFVKKEYSENLKGMSLEVGYVASKFREARDESGNLTFEEPKSAIKMLEGMEVFNVETEKLEKF